MSSEAAEVAAEVIEEPTSELSVTYTPAVIDDNLTAVEAWVKSQVEPYRGGRHRLRRRRAAQGGP